MQADYILLDTNVLSDMRKQKPHPQVLEFVQGLRGGQVAIAAATVFELERGVLDLTKQDPVLAIKRAAWLERLLKTDIYFLPRNNAVARLQARMSICGPLKDFWVNHEDAKKVKFGSDIEIAATSIIHEIPIATADIRDFLRIHEHFAVPGLYDPRHDVWHVRPPIGWSLQPPANGNARKSGWCDQFSDDEIELRR